VLLMQHERKMKKALSQSKNLFQNTMEVRREANLKRMEEVQKRLTLKTKEFNVKVTEEISR
jgi:hypothetical protein